MDGLCHSKIKKSRKYLNCVLKKWVTIHNVPLPLQTDNRTEFKNSVHMEFCKFKNIKYFWGHHIIFNFKEL